MMTFPRFWLFFLACLLGLPAAAFSVRDKLGFNHGHLARSYYLHIPMDLRPNAPLVVILHGLGGSAAKIRYGIGFNTLANRHGFAVVYPQGTRIDQGSTHWNARFDFSTVDDVGFIAALVADLQKIHGFDPQASFALGISNGGYLAYSMACQKPEVFTAIASLIGTMSGADWKDCTPDRPTPVLHMHGTADPMIAFDGFKRWYGGWGGAPAVPKVVAFWADMNGAALVSKDTKLPNTTFFKYQNAVSEAEVWFLQMDGFGHDWPHKGNIGYSSNDIVWDFFSRFVERPA